MGEPVTDIVFVRHGETSWNSSSRIQGHLDSGLTRMGIAQGRAVARTLSTETFDAIYSSDLGRAMQTAELIGESLGLKVIPDRRLREKCYGVVQGLTREEFEARYPEGFAAYRGGDPDYAVPEGESQLQVHTRAVECANELAERHAGQRIILVTHGGILTCLFQHVIGLDVSSRRHFSLLNASINRFTCTAGHWRMVSWGETSHLRGLSAEDDL